MPTAWSIDGLLFLNCLFQLKSSCIGELFSDRGSTVTPDITDTELENNENASDASGPEDLSKTPWLLKSALIKEVRQFNSNCVVDINMRYVAVCMV